MGETRGLEVRSSRFSEFRTSIVTRWLMPDTMFPPISPVPPFPLVAHRLRLAFLAPRYVVLADFFTILLHSPYHRTNPVAHVTPPPKLPSKTMSWGRIFPERTAWSSAIGNDADDVLP